MDFKTKIKSTVATGTAPFDIASTTAVANLNADLLDGKHASDFSLTSHNHDGTYEPADTTILKDADIGVTVQGYNANTVVDASYVHTDNNYTTTEKNKLKGIADGAGVGDMLKSVYDTNSNNIVDNAEKVNNHTVETDVPSGAKFTDTIYTHPNHSGDVTSVADGVTTIADKAVTLSKMANINADTIIGRYTAGTGVPELLAIGSGLNTTSGVLKASIVDNLISDDTDKALSAAQGKALNTNKANIASPAFTDTPTAPTAPTGTDTTQLATTEFVQQELDVHKADFMPHGIDNAGFHNSIFRGKNIGVEPTAKQYADIANGSFEDMYIGDYWTIGGVNYRIAAFNYFYNVGDTALTVNHAVIVPDTKLYDATMNSTNITTGAYAGSLMRTTNLASAISTIESAFAGHVLTHRQLLTNVTADGKASNWSWYDAKVELMNEVMVYGSSVFGVSDRGNGFNVGSSNGQLPLFALRHDMMHNRQNWWLRDVVSAAYFATVYSGGFADYNNASNAFGVRPAFSIS